MHFSKNRLSILTRTLLINLEIIWIKIKKGFIVNNILFTKV